MGSRKIRIAALTAAVLGAGLYLFWPLISTLTKDTDSEGVFAVPGKRVIEVDEGTYGVYYREDRKLGTRSVGPKNQQVNESLPTPSGFGVSFRGLGGAGPLDYQTVYDVVEVQGIGNVTTKQVGRIDVPADGRFEIVTEGDTKGLKKAAVTVGEDRSQEHGFERLDALLKPHYIVIAVFAFLFLRHAPWSRWFGGGRPSEPPSPPSPTTSPPPPAETPVPPIDSLDELERLARLRASGAIDTAEFERLKGEVLR